jgi:alpha-N-acetylglucosaminidase
VGAKGEHLDYAYKHWAGLVSDYYKPRWSLFFKMLEDSLVTGWPFDEKQFRAEFFSQVNKQVRNSKATLSNSITILVDTTGNTSRLTNLHDNGILSQHV